MAKYKVAYFVQGEVATGGEHKEARVVAETPAEAAAAVQAEAGPGFTLVSVLEVKRGRPRKNAASLV